MCASGAFVADVESVELVQPGEGALDNPASAVEAGAVAGLATCAQRFGAEGSQLTTVEVVVAAIRDQPLWSPLRTARPAPHRGIASKSKSSCVPFVAVCARNGPGEREPAAVGQEVVLRAATAPVDRAWTRRGAPSLAWT